MSKPKAFKATTIFGLSCLLVSVICAAAPVYALTYNQIVAGQTGGKVLGASTPAFVQATSSGVFNACCTNPTTATFGSNTTAGNLIIATIWETGSSAGVAGTISDSQGNPFTLAASTSYGNNFVAYLYYASNINGGPDTVSFNWNSGATINNLGISEYAGIAATNPLDQVSQSNGGSYPVTSIPTGSVTTTSGGELLYSFAGFTPAVSGSASSASGWTQRVQDNSNLNIYLYSADQVAPTTGSYSNTFTVPSSYGGTSFIAAFKPAVTGPPDTTPPSTPTNLSATAISSSQINLSWTASTDNAGVTGYTIYRGGVQIGTSATNSYSNTGLTASTQYTYTVSAYDAAGNNSAQSSSASATTQSPPPPDTTPPSTPTNLSAAAISPSQISLTWTSSTDNVGVTGYKIYRGGTQIGTSATNTYSDTGLTASTQYTYTVSAYDAAGNNSSQSTSASATTLAASQGNTYTAASCSQADVNAVINGPTHTAVDGDTIVIPAGSCTWTTGVTVPSGRGITITGVGTPNSAAASFGASSSCTATAITVSNGIVAFHMTPAYGNSTSRLSCMSLPSGSGSGVALSVLGTCAANGCPNLRMDNVTFPNWSGHTENGISYGIMAIGDMFGVIDHDTVTGTGGYLQLVEQANASYLGVGQWGDNSWAQPEDYGSANFLFFENSIFTAAGTTENEGGAGGLESRGGGRVVIRFNQFNNMDHYNFAMGWHGTESGGRPRGGRDFEYYGNTFTCAAGQQCGSVASIRSGTGLFWGNTVDASASGATLSSLFNLATLRSQGSTGGWGACDGSTPYDEDDGITYYSGTVASGGGTPTITVSGASPGWSTNQWFQNGAPYSVHDVTQNTGSEITANTANTLTVAYGGGPGAWLAANGDTIEILRATACLDQSGGRGAGILYSGSPATPVSSVNEISSPAYFWSNAISGNTYLFNGGTGVFSDTARVIRGRDFYEENMNQAAQTSQGAPFDGTATIGLGHGTLADRPATCTQGVAYWATDQGNWNQSGNGFGQGQLYKCTSSNTWTLFYTPYQYPHPLVTGAAAPPNDTTPPAPPTGVSVQ